MTEPIVHIGYPKTASTWFQRRLYPLVENYKYIPRQTVRQALLCAHAFGFDTGRAQERLGVTGRDVLPPLLCEEHLSGHIATGGQSGALTKEFAERIDRVLPGARIVIFIRHQVDIIGSFYAQYVRNGGTHSPTRLLFPARDNRKGVLHKPYKQPLFDFDHFHYIALIRHYRALFGADKVHVFAFESLRHDPHGFLESYTDRLGLTVDLDRVELAPANASYRHRTLRLARILNHFTYRDVIDKRYLLPIIPQKKIKKWLLQPLNDTRFAGRRMSPRELLDEEIAAFIEDYYVESNRALVEETGLPLADYCYPGTTTEGATTRDASRH